MWVTLWIVASMCWFAHVSQVVEFGRYEMDAWYYSPYPDVYGQQSKLYVCEFTLKYFRKKRTLLGHLAKLDIRHPPGESYFHLIAPWGYWQSILMAHCQNLFGLFDLRP